MGTDFSDHYWNTFGHYMRVDDEIDQLFFNKPRPTQIKQDGIPITPSYPPNNSEWWDNTISVLMENEQPEDNAPLFEGQNSYSVERVGKEKKGTAVLDKATGNMWILDFANMKLIFVPKERPPTR